MFAINCSVYLSLDITASLSDSLLDSFFGSYTYTDTDTHVPKILWPSGWESEIPLQDERVPDRHCLRPRPWHPFSYQGLSEILTTTTQMSCDHTAHAHNQNLHALTCKAASINPSENQTRFTWNTHLTLIRNTWKALHTRTHLAIQNAHTYASKVNIPQHHWLWPVNKASLNSISPLRLIQLDQPRCQ